MRQQRSAGRGIPARRKRFDLVLPFHYPFTQILDQAEGGL
jgi:hypothetical protein